MEKPIFTVKTKETNKKYEIYLNGNVVGFDEDVSIFNQIPSSMNWEVSTMKEKIFHSLVEKLSEVITGFGFDVKTFYSVNSERALKSSEEQSKLSKPNFSLKTVQSSKAKVEK